MPAFSRSVGYLGHAWCRSDSQILARNGVFVVTVACKSKTTQSELCLDEASAVCQARTPRRRRMRIRSENSLCRLWDFERPRPQIPIPRHRKDFVVVCAVVSTGSPAAGGARASRRLLATGCAGGGRPNARTRGARCILTTRRDGADRARRDGVDHARRDGADRARRDGDRRGNAGNSRAAAPPGVRLRLRARWVPFPGGRKFSWCFSGWAERPWRYPSW